MADTATGSRRTKWLIAAAAGCIAATMATGYALQVGVSQGVGPAIEPDYYLWAWRREEDLSFIDPRRVKVALWTATVTLAGDNFTVAHRTNKVTYPTPASVVGVVRLEATGVPDAATVPSLADAIIDASRPFRPIEHQVDFDARLSQRGFYRHLLEELRERAAGARLSITALASWCFHDDWTEGLPVDAAVPMIYRMGPDGDVIRHALFAERKFPNPICAGNVGYSADEPLAPVDHLRRVFLFHPKPWSEARFRKLAGQVEALL